jgi:hypothetical protein
LFEKSLSLFIFTSRKELSRFAFDLQDVLSDLIKHRLGSGYLVDGSLTLAGLLSVLNDVNQAGSPEIARLSGDGSAATIFRMFVAFDNAVAAVIPLLNFFLLD